MWREVIGGQHVQQWAVGRACGAQGCALHSVLGVQWAVCGGTRCAVSEVRSLYMGHCVGVQCVEGTVCPLHTLYAPLNTAQRRRCAEGRLCRGWSMRAAVLQRVLRVQPAECGVWPVHSAQCAMCVVVQCAEFKVRSVQSRLADTVLCT